MKKLLCFLCLAGAGWLYFHEGPAKWRGMPAAHEPVQLVTNLPPPFQHSDYTITPLASYSIKAVVLSRDRYRFDQGAKLAPIDLALGWGPMSVASAINDLSFSQSGRFYEYTWKNEPPLDPEQIKDHSANTHCIPATAQVRHDLLNVKRHDLVTLEGYLVEVGGPDGFKWKSSLSRTDSRGGACELFWVTSVSRQSL